MIELVLADDWELRGDGSGDMRTIQFRTIRALCQIYEAYGIRGSFNAEVLQQLAHLRLARRHPELGELASEWEETVRDVLRRGHDVQLHLHPQWSRAHFRDGRWRLDGAWSILDYGRPEVDAMLREAKTYLEAVLRQVDDGYRCVTFRSGSWCVAPGPHVLPALAAAGILVDISIVDGIAYTTPHVTLDYRGLAEPFLPYYPQLDDARRPAAGRQDIVCVPTHSFRGGLWPFALRVLARNAQRVTPLGGPLRRFLAPADVPLPGSSYDRDYGQRHWTDRGDRGARLSGTGHLIRTIRKAVARVSGPRVSDLSLLSFGEMRKMLEDVRRRAEGAGWDRVPIVLENHTKDLGYARPIERFARLVSMAPDVEVVTLRDLAANVERGQYPIRSA